MSDSDEKKVDEAARPRVIKVKLAGAEHPVNTLAQIEDPTGLSLICPFPSLKLDMAIDVQMPVETGDVASRPGRLRKIGVVYDPEVGLPKISLRVEFAPEQAEAVPADETLGEPEDSWTVADLGEDETEDPPWSIAPAEFTAQK